MPTDNALTILTLLGRTIPFVTDRTESMFWCALCDASRDTSRYPLEFDPLYQPENHEPRCPWRLATQLLDKEGIAWKKTFR